MSGIGSGASVVQSGGSLRPGMARVRGARGGRLRGRQSGKVDQWFRLPFLPTLLGYWGRNVEDHLDIKAGLS